MLIAAIVLTALALAAVLIFWRQGHVDPAEFDRRAKEAEAKDATTAPAGRARPPSATRNRGTRRNLRPTTRPDPAPQDESE